MPAGDSALLVRFGRLIAPDINRRVRALAVDLDANPLPGCLELVPGYASLLVYYDPLLTTFVNMENGVRQRLSTLDLAGQLPVKRVEIPVYYGGEHGPDLTGVAEVHQLTPDEVIRIHSGRDYPVYMMGFTPGFPYLGEMDPAIATPRLSTPRSRVPAGSVGIAGEQTGIYPVESPGGWQIIGWTPLRLFDPESREPFLLSPGDIVRFVPVE